MVTEAVEIERKYDSDTATSPPLDGLPGVASVDGPVRHTLEATYFDTDDLRLARAKVTLRRRSGGQDAGWHLKLPGTESGERVELRLPLGRTKTVPDKLVELTLSRTRGAPLAPIALLRTERTQWRLLDNNGGVLAEVVSDDVSAQLEGAPDSATEWHEVEVELVGGSPKLLDAVEARLREFGLRPSESASKLSRLLADRLPAEAEPDTSDGSPTAAQVVLNYLRTQIGALVAYDPKVRRDEPDAVHQMRVAARRARSALQAFRRVLDREQATEAVNGLRWLGTVLAGAREAEAQRERLLNQLRALPAELVVGPIVNRIDGHLTRTYTQAREALLAELRGPRYLALLDRSQALLANPPFTEEAGQPAGKLLAKDCRRALRRVRRAGRRYLDDPQGERRDVALHETRKAGKRARYAFEAAAPVLGKPARRVAKRLKALQRVLGQHQDIVVSRGVLREHGMQAFLDGENAFSYGLLLGQDIVRAEHLRAQLPEKLSALDN